MRSIYCKSPETVIMINTEQDRNHLHKIKIIFQQNPAFVRTS